MLKTKLFTSLILAIALAVPASSQLLIRAEVDGQASTVSNGGSLTLNAPAVGQAASATITLTYLGTTSAAFSAAPQIFGSGDFTASNPGAVTLSSAQSASFTLRFTPQRITASQSVLTWLYKEGDSQYYSVFSLNLSGTVPSVLVSSVLSTGNYLTVADGGLFSFADTLITANSDMTIALTNRGSGASTVNSIAVSGDSYQLLGMPLLPYTLSAGAELRITVRFLPKSAGAHPGALQIASDGWTYSAVLQGTAPASQFTYAFTGASGTQAPFSQPSIGLSLAEASAIDLEGTLTLTAATNYFAADPAVQFSSGGTKVAFTIPAGTLAAVFPSGSTQLMIQTGTVAELIVITPTFSSTSGVDLTPDSVTPLKITIPSLAPVILDASISSITTSGFTLNVTGYSTTRALDHLTVLFKGASGVSLPATATTISLSTAATFWYATSASQALGGVFSVSIPFTVTVSGSASATLASYIASVTVSATNEVGTSGEVQITLQ
jgi:hypothetical protein